MILSIPDVRPISHRISLCKCGSYTSCQREPSCVEIEAWHLPVFGQLWDQQVQDEIRRQVFRSIPQHFLPRNCTSAKRGPGRVPTHRRLRLSIQLHDHAGCAHDAAVWGAGANHRSIRCVLRCAHCQGRSGFRPRRESPALKGQAGRQGPAGQASADGTRAHPI